jgi:stage V sporulation protein D (sporulation-specific penicillin-binding protein)
VHPLERWGPLAKAYVSFGQGISVTPLQLAAAVTAVANEGTLLEPHVVAAVGRGEVRRTRHAGTRIQGHPIEPATARVLKSMLEGVVAAGTGRGAAVAGYRVAGKTGTAQIPVRGGYRGYLPSFVGFAPAGRPSIVGLVAIAEPQGQYYGGQVAAPVFGAIARQVLLYRGIHPERERLAVWPGETVMASLPPETSAMPAPPEIIHSEMDDGDDAAVGIGIDPAFPPSPQAGAPPGTGDTTGESRPESDHSSSQGGRSHASF